MATLNQIVEGLRLQVEAFSTSFATKLAELNGAKESAISGGNIARSAAADIESVFTRKDIYVDAVAGDDAQDGLTYDTRVRTWGRAIALLPRGTRCILRLVTDLVADTEENLQSAPTFWELYGVGDDGAGLQRRKLTFVDATDAPGRAGGVRLRTSAAFKTIEVDFEMAHTSGSGPIVVDGRLEVIVEDALITRTGTGGPLFNGLSSAHYDVGNVVIDPSAAGHIIAGVDAGGDPNDRPGVTANFTQG